MTVLLLFPMHAAAQDTRPWEAAALQRWLAVNPPLQTEASDDPAEPLLSSVARFYRMVGYRNVWVGADGLRPLGEDLLRAIQDASANGLHTEAYRLPPCENGWIRATALDGRIDPTRLATSMRLDMAFTASLLRYVSHLHHGRIAPQTLDRKWIFDPPHSRRNFADELAAAVNTGRLTEYLNSLPPRQPAYGRLRTALAAYEQIRSNGGWERLDSGPSIRRGDSDPRVPALRSRLILEGDLAASASEAGQHYDRALETAVLRFQYRHGLTPDGVVGKRTLAALNVPVEARIRQLRLNMERWRWYPDSFGERYVWVNIPDFKLTVMERDWAVQRMRAIVGRTKRQTPNLSGRMTYLEFNPYWNVPGKIARKDILPKIMKDPAYLIRQGFKVFDSWKQDAAALNPEGIAWNQVSKKHFPFRLRQEPSALNALGQVKFMFPNKQSVYIHDTPGKSLFQRDRRNFSSGCVRVESPLVLARYLLHGQRWDQARLEDTLGSGERKTVVLKNPIPVHLVYFTAWIDESGKVNFREDVYGRDRQLDRAINQRSKPTLFCDRQPAAGNLLASHTPNRR
jgi:murein L,D-transpeptidase YcbB/YkuD